MSKIMVVDDEPVTRESLVRILSSKGFEALAVGDGEAAVNAALKTKPDLVLLDVMLPKLGGMEVCQKIKSLSSEFIPIIMVTGKGSIGDKARGFYSGADDYCPKPVRPDELLLRINSLLRIKAHQDELRRNNLKDPLTGVPNRQYLLSKLKEEKARAGRTSLPLTAVQLDIDDFKTVNDLFGRQFTDRVLARVAHFLQSQIRPTDTYGRLGDDEFLIIMPGTGMKDGFQVANRVRKALRDQPFEIEMQSFKFTCSMGLCPVSQVSGPEIENILARLDSAVLKAKMEGGNRIHIFDREE